MTSIHVGGFEYYTEGREDRFNYFPSSGPPLGYAEPQANIYVLKCWSLYKKYVLKKY